MALRSTRARRGLAAALACAVLGTTVLAAVPAATADPGRTIEQVKAELQELEMRAESASEQYSEAQDRLSKITKDTEAAATQVEKARAEVRASQEVIGAIAASAYQAGGMDTSLQLFLAEEPEEFLAQAAALDQVVSSQATALRRAATSKLRLAQATARLEAKQSEQAQAVEQAESRAAEIESAVADTEQYLNQLQEEERRRLAELAAAEAAASAKAAAEAAAALEQDGGSGGGSGNGPAQPGSNGAGSSGAAGTGSQPSSNGAGGAGAAGTGAASNGAGSGGAAATGAGSNAAGSSGASSSGNYSARAATAVRYALAQVGEPYSYSANPPSSWDCSKLTAWAWAQAGVSLTAYSYAQANQVRRISTSELQPGDILFYFRGAHHVAMYIGGGKIVEASSPSTGVRVTDAWNSWSSAHFSFAGRPI